MKNDWKEIAKNLAKALRTTPYDRCDQLSHSLGSYHDSCDQCSIVISNQLALIEFESQLHKDNESK